MMVSPSKSNIGEIYCCNEFINDPRALEEIWRERGYWFFRGVLDQSALQTVSSEIIAVLKSRGFVGRDSSQPFHNGTSLDDFPKLSVAGSAPFPEIAKSQPWRGFLHEPAIIGFFSQLFHGAPYWVPVTELRVIPPGDNAGSPFIRPHQDGFYNIGYDFFTAWIPLFDIPRTAGGLAIAEGHHLDGNYHDTNAPPRFLIPEGKIPQNSWRTTDYQAGDIVIFDRQLPHSGMRNRTQDRFRVSFDIRGIRPGAPRPVLGIVENATCDSISVRDHSGSVQRFTLDDESYCRSVGENDGYRLTADEVCVQYAPGLEIMLTHQDGMIRLLREPTYRLV